MAQLKCMHGGDSAENASSNKTSGLVKLIQQCFVERRQEMESVCGGKSRFRTDLCEAENVVNEEQHILTLSITEVLSNGQTCKDTQRFGHCVMPIAGDFERSALPQSEMQAYNRQCLPV